MRPACVGKALAPQPTSKTPISPTPRGRVERIKEDPNFKVDGDTKRLRQVRRRRRRAPLANAHAAPLGLSLRQARVCTSEQPPFISPASTAQPVCIAESASTGQPGSETVISILPCQRSHSTRPSLSCGANPIDRKTSYIIASLPSAQTQQAFYKLEYKRKLKMAE